VPVAEPATASSRGLIVFSHANGFGAGTYRVHFELWRQAGFEVRAIDRLGHDPDFPVSSNWRELRDQLLTFTERTGQAPVHFVGHSLGGLLSLLAACRRPDLAAGVVMLDSPVVTGWRAHSLHVLKRTGVLPHLSPGKVSQRRRRLWPDRAAVHAHFATKPVFARWDPRVLADYVETGFDEGPDGRIHLGFDAAIETRIYNTLPHHLGALLRRHPPRCPVGFIAGTDSEEMRQGGSGGARALAGPRYTTIEGTHLFPMQCPEETAQRVLSLIAQM